MQLPIYKDSNTALMQMQNRWSSLLNPVLSNSLNKVQILSNVQLSTGPNVINHLLGVKQQGWFLVDKDAAGDVYRSAPLNNLTLTLTASAPMTVSIGVY